jgi:hypothetical protein
VKIIFPNGLGGVAIIHPTGELPIEQVALKDVPPNVPYRFVNEDGIPSDRIFRDAWEADFSNPDGYGIGPEAWFAQRVQGEE